eukprot:CAMPEP_0183702630 /NCGR_PEP_ID=MMETSP0737-20130205/672_1 /TAXON_ID=385413 /ORGANISM="Thalassiosira miniscula, Strain CCMP1093" /LENGTH=66 /DNA_ID=CAMNT_0025929273 /DNA_START=43 /DNA_END=240 /DNA_ORIENTATION=-
MAANSSLEWEFVNRGAMIMGRRAQRTTDSARSPESAAISAALSPLPMTMTRFPSTCFALLQSDEWT